MKKQEKVNISEQKLWFSITLVHTINNNNCITKYHRNEKRTYIIITILLMLMVLINAPKFLEYEKVDADVRKDFDLEDKRWNDLLGNMNYWTREDFELNKGH